MGLCASVNKMRRKTFRNEANLTSKHKYVVLMSVRAEMVRVRKLACKLGPGPPGQNSNKPLWGGWGRKPKTLDSKPMSQHSLLMSFLTRNDKIVDPKRTKPAKTPKWCFLFRTNHQFDILLMWAVLPPTGPAPVQSFLFFITLLNLTFFKKK